MNWLLMAAALPHLLWDKGPDTLSTLRTAQIPCVAVPAAQAKAWESSGFCVSEAPSAVLAKLPDPGVRWATRGAGTASATSAPWITANGWRFLREPGKKFLYEVPRDSAILAAAEAFAYGADAYLRVAPEDLNTLGSFLMFLKSIKEDPGLKAAANIAIVDDGSRLIPEALNMMARKNLMFRVVKAPDSSADLNVKIGSAEFPNTTAANPSKFADEVRTKLTDRKRCFRVYGTESVLGRLEVGPDRARVHLINYTTSKVEEVRIRVLGSYTVSRASVFGIENAAVTDEDAQGGTTEFTVPVMGPYAVIDLNRR